MHAVFGLKQLGLTFELKGGTSLSKGFGVIHSFSEDISLENELVSAAPSAIRAYKKPSRSQSRVRVRLAARCSNDSDAADGVSFMVFCS